jgi:hypothetical protein
VPGILPADDPVARFTLTLSLKAREQGPEY